jgi:hypothetical protein
MNLDQILVGSSVALQQWMASQFTTLMEVAMRGQDAITFADVAYTHKSVSGRYP